jgi:hypothetical protein
VFSHFSSVRRLAGVSLLGALVAGCSAAGTPAAYNANPSARSLAAGGVQANRILASGRSRREQPAGSNAHGWLSREAKGHKGKNVIYWGSYDSNTITIFSSKGVNGKQEGQIVTGLSNPERLFVDKKHNVYATNIGNNTITAYKPGQTSPFLTVSNGVNSPTGLTVDAAGTVYCANVGNNTITEYPKGSTSPSLTVQLSGSPEYLATDAHDNLYVAIGLDVLEFAPGSTTGTNLGLDIGSPGALEVDRSGNIIVIDESKPSIDVFPAGQTEPSKQIAVTRGFPFAISLSKSEKQVYVSVEANSGPFVIQALAYPNGSTLTDKLTTAGGDWPIAVSPDAVLGS